MVVTQTGGAGEETRSFAQSLEIAVLIPCHNEEVAIDKVISGFSQALPTAKIYVYDNNSTDRTIEVARAAGAIVVSEHLQGKGNVVRRMFSDVDADVYVLVDGDDTYEAGSAPAMVDMLLAEGADMVTGTRVTEIVAAYRPGHRMGNVTLTGIVRLVFGSRITDMLSGYRIFSRRFVKTFPALSSGFETETELTIHALELRMPLAEMETPYRDRAEGSTSKLSTYKDGVRILFTIIRLIKEERPLYFFALLAFLVFVAAMALGIPLIVEYERIHLVPRLPSAILAAALVMLSFLSFVCGLIMDSLALARKEAKRLAYLSIPPACPPHRAGSPRN
jgi:glycosyltransferase involved in cell wall biosynthesis